MNKYLTVPAPPPDSPTMCRARLASDPQAYNVKPVSDKVPVIQVDLASPQSPDSVNLLDEFGQANQQQQEEEQGLMMKPPLRPGEPNKPGEADGAKDQQKLMRCLSDPGPSADEDEDEAFLP
ncbi:sodium/hydrogen exchanger 1-like isoform X2 [Archocentrus centrarchus]|nr:sodium/hydrogen exchanger 1-like isoform X2 [Archocentrus centrarchus]